MDECTISLVTTKKVATTGVRRQSVEVNRRERPGGANVQGERKIMARRWPLRLWRRHEILRTLI